jgi:predicted ATPase
MQTGGHALPWDDMLAFLDLAIATALADRTRMQAHTDWVFFDRGLVDAASAMEHLTNHPKLVKMNALHPYHRRVFLAPPWREIYDMDDERRHGMQAAIDEYERLKSQLPRLGYEVIELPKSTISSRADFVLETLARH